MSLAGKSLGVLISCAPTEANFQHGVKLAETAVNTGVSVYLYCLDEAVTGLGDERLQSLQTRGLRLFGCAYAAQRRQLPLNDLATFVGLPMLSDVMANTDRFISFN